MAGRDRCPTCGSVNYRYNYYTEEYWGIVEQHGYCDRCGYMVEQCYSQAVDGYMPPLCRGYRDKYGKYHAKNSRKRKRMKRRFNIKYGSKDWMLQMI